MALVLTVRLNDAETAVLDGLVQATGKSRSDAVRQALRQQGSAGAGKVLKGRQSRNHAQSLWR